MNSNSEACCDTEPFMGMGAKMTTVHVKSEGLMWVAFSLSMMTAGLVGNGLAITIIYRSYQKKQSKKNHSFLLCVGALSLTDFMGKLLTSPIVITVYLSDLQWDKLDPSGYICQFFGVCMTMFSLCPLFIASTMAIERTLAVHFPIWYSSNTSSRAIVNVLLGIWIATLGFSLLPLAGWGQYRVQWPGTWSFMSINQDVPGTLRFTASYASLGLLSLATTFICNLATIKALVSRCKSRTSAVQTGGQWGRIMTETLIQLLGITCVLAACWTPLLVNLLRMISGHMSTNHCMESTLMQSLELQKNCSLYLATLRLSCVNQILDPWIYLLIKWILTQKGC